jgi:hypothetical protein
VVLDVAHPLYRELIRARQPWPHAINRRSLKPMR